ncbi:MAG: N-acetylmuramoyl-L-alanine amidase [Halomonadaceae bacterium]|nr:N-acetylmuramoyl-L-alanine amidase [Halomonadaceae bacterium]
MRWIDEVAAIPAAPPQRQTVMVSAGHSDATPGAEANGYTEADLVTGFRSLVSQALDEQGIRHCIDGEGRENLPLRDAVKIAAGADLAIEFHCNAATPDATGVETLSRPEHYPLGERLCTTIADTLGIDNRGAKPEGSGQHSRLAFVSDGGGIIVELFFLTNKRDLASFLGGQRGLAREVARVIADAARQPVTGGA